MVNASQAWIFSENAAAITGVQFYRLQARCSAEYAYLKDALSQPNATWKLHEFGDERAMRPSSVDAISG